MGRQQARSERRDPFNRRRLTLARESRGLTQNELAKRSGLSQSKVSKLEHGVAVADDETIAKLSRVLEYPPSFLARTDPRYGMPLRYHRKKQSVSRNELKRVYARIAIACQLIETLWRNVDVESTLEVPRLDVDDHGGDAPAIALMVRQSWLVPPGPIENLVSLLEQAGVVIVTFDFGVTGIDAVGMALPDPSPTIIFLSDTLPGDRARFTLAHELGHLVMHSVPPKNAAEVMEPQANQFAQEFLMPNDDIARDFRGRVDLGTLATLKEHWRVSMAALLMKAHTVGAVSHRQRRSLFMRMSQLGYKRVEPVSVDREAPALVGEVVRIYREELGYTFAEIAKANDLREQDVRPLLMEATPHDRLRLV